MNTPPSQHAIKAAKILGKHFMECEPYSANPGKWVPEFWETTIQSAIDAATADLQAQLAEARATKNMHKERQQQEIERATALEAKCAAMSSLLREVRQWHSDQDSSGYNGCDIPAERCMWCQKADEALKP